MKRIWLLAILSASLSFLLVSCEPMDVVDPFGIVHDDDDDSSSGSPSSGSSSSRSSSSHVSASDLSGTWSGRAGTAQGRVTLRLSQNGSSLSGSWTYSNGDRRSCSGSRSGNSITLRDLKSGGSTWRATVSSDGRSITGTGYKTNGQTYRLSFSR